MANERDNPRPGGSPGQPARRVPEGGTYQPDKLAFEIPDDILGDETDGGKLAKRLIVAFILIAITAVLNLVVLRKWDMDLPPMVLFGAFGVIFVASILPSFEAKPESFEDEDESCSSDGCAVGCCQGPRPIGEMSRKVAQKRQQMRLGNRQPKS